jgi:beta-glucanase (GH16 family)
MRNVKHLLFAACAIFLLSSCSISSVDSQKSQDSDDLYSIAKKPDNPGKPGGGGNPGDPYDPGPVGELPTPTLSYDGYTEVWSDEFDGEGAINSAVWTNEIGTGRNGWGNNELEYYTDSLDNVYLSGGELHIVAREERIRGNKYTSARIKTQQKVNFTYGIIEAKIKCPQGYGLWPAFWMLGESITSDGWPACGEVDIMENKGTNVQYGTAHYDANGYANSGSTITVDISQYHDYTIKWTPTTIAWYVDGSKFHEFDITASEKSEFHEPFFLLLNLAVGGNFAGPVGWDTQFPAEMVVDYVKVYKQ